MAKPYDRFLEVKAQRRHMLNRISSQPKPKTNDTDYLIAEVERLRGRVDELLGYANEQVELRRGFRRQRDILDSGMTQVHIAIQEDAETGVYNLEDMREILDLIEHFKAKGKTDGA